MFYIVGGATRSGKTIIAHRMLEEKGVPFLPTDLITMGFVKGMPEFGIKMWDDSEEIAVKLWPFLSAFIRSGAESGYHYLIEGDIFLPSLVAQLQAELPPNYIKPCFMGYTETTPEKKLEYIREFKGHTNDWIQAHSDIEILLLMHNAIKYSETLKKECEETQIPYFDTSKHFKSTLNDVMEYLSHEAIP